MKITVIGVGKLGLGFSLLLENAGFDVLGVDIYPNYVDLLNKKIYKTLEPEYTSLLEKSKNFRATTSLNEGLDFADIIFILVQTPNSGGDKFYDHSHLSNLLYKINSLKVENKHLIIGCTVMPKYIDEVGRFLIRDCNNCSLSYNPEFVAQGEIVKGFRYPDIVLVGTESNQLKEQLILIYDKMCYNKPKYCFMTPLEAEIVKISLNGYITTKISYANMISDLCDTLSADKRVVLDAIGSDARVGNKYFKPGYSYGGPCFPRDTKALKLIMEQNNIDSLLLEGTIKGNEEHVIFQTKQLLSENKDTYIVEDVCYKDNSKIPIIEESAKLKIAFQLLKSGKKVIIKDCKEIIDEVQKYYGNLFSYELKM